MKYDINNIENHTFKYQNDIKYYYDDHHYVDHYNNNNVNVNSWTRELKNVIINKSERWQCIGGLLVGFLSDARIILNESMNESSQQQSEYST